MELVNQEGILPLNKRVKKELPSKNIWIYTGYSFDDDLIPWSKKYNFTKEILNCFFACFKFKQQISYF